MMKYNGLNPGGAVAFDKKSDLNPGIVVITTMFSQN
jgi:hypothetical protein